jgi:anthranilate phosphoribosyltransferase
VLNIFKQQLAQSVHLNDEQIAAAVNQLVDEAVPTEQKADFLCSLAVKRETTAEIAARSWTYAAPAATG